MYLKIEQVNKKTSTLYSHLAYGVGVFLIIQLIIFGWVFAGKQAFFQ